MYFCHGLLSLTWVDWFVVFVLIAGITFLGARLYARVRDRSHFFMRGRRFGKIFMMFFAFGTGTGSNDAISVVAGSWRAGLAGIWWAFLWLWSTPFYWLVAPVMRRMRALTTSDFFEARSGSRTATLYSICGIVMSIAILAGGLYSSGKMINALTGGDLNALAQQIDWRVPHFEWNSAAAAIQGSWRQVEGFELAILEMTVRFVIYGLSRPNRNETFTVPNEDWWADYYTPLQERINLLRPRSTGDPDLAVVLEMAECEIDLFTRHHDSYGYYLLPGP